MADVFDTEKHLKGKIAKIETNKKTKVIETKVMCKGIPGINVSKLRWLALCVSQAAARDSFF